MSSQILLTRNDFRDGIFARDNHKCVFCDNKAVDAHHIIERRLWDSGGYYLDNGASVCNKHHIKCETTEISVEDVRYACGISKIIVPEHLYHDQSYDKWGNPIMPNHQRLKGELFYDESVQKILSKGGVLGLFTDLVKYPRTHHLPWSECISDDDRIIKSLDEFLGKRVIVTKKKDGENTTLYPNYMHARSVDSRSHPSRSWVKQFHSQFCSDIPEAWRVCGENLYAKHSIHYVDLPSYFMGFSLWNNRNTCLDWDVTMEWFELLGITPVPKIFDGIFDEKAIRQLWNSGDRDHCEGYVIRVADAFEYGEFRTKVAKFVRKDHVQTVKHWMHGQRMEINGLAK